MRKQDKHIVVLVLLVFLVVLIGFFVPNILEDLIDSKVFPFKNSNYNEAIDLLDYYGSIFSCVVTVFILGVTIMFENSERKEDNLLTYKPIIEYIGVNKPVSYTYKKIFIVDKNLASVEDIPFDEYRLVFKNVGRGESENTKLKITNQIAYIDENSERIEVDNLKLKYDKNFNEELGEIIVGDYFGVHIELPKIIHLATKEELLKVNDIHLKMLISYEDMFYREKYKLNISAVLTVFEDKSMKSENELLIPIRYDKIKVSPSRNLGFVDYWYDHE